MKLPFGGNGRINSHSGNDYDTYDTMTIDTWELFAMYIIMVAFTFAHVTYLLIFIFAENKCIYYAIVFF